MHFDSRFLPVHSLVYTRKGDLANKYANRKADDLWQSLDSTFRHHSACRGVDKTRQSDRVFLLVREVAVDYAIPECYCRI